MLFTGFSVIHYLDIIHLLVLKIIKTPGLRDSTVHRPLAKNTSEAMQMRSTGKAFLSFVSSSTCWAKLYIF